MGLEFDYCCFCIDLRVGCLIIGYLNLIGNIALILMSIMGLTAAGAVASHHGIASLGVMALAILSVLLIVCLLFLVFTIVLLVGLHQHKRGHVKAYLIYTLIFLILYTIMFFASLAVVFTPFSIARDIISIVLSIYFLLVMRSYYLRMDDPSITPAMYNTA